MDEITHLFLAKKLLEVCNADQGSVIYSLLPNIDKQPSYFYGLYAHTLETQPKLLDSAIEILAKKKTRVSKNSYEYQRILEEEKRFLTLLNGLDKNNTIISNQKIDAALSSISHIYFDSFTRPVQFFLPHVSFCSSQWDFLNNINYLNFKEKIYQNNPNLLHNEINKNNIFNVKLELDSFPLVIKKRLIKEKSLDKPLDPAAMIKAMIIRLGETSRPSISYEIIDFTIRQFFRNLNFNRYLRADREIAFLKSLELSLVKILKEI